MSERIPNVVELGRRPDPVRYIWFAYDNTEDGEEVRMGATWATLRRAQEEMAHRPMVKVIDLYNDKVHTFFGDEVDEFLDEWRNHYFDDGWVLESS